MGRHRRAHCNVVDICFYIDSVVYKSWPDRMRVVFASLGTFMNSIVPTAHASTVECKSMKARQKPTY